MTLFEEKKRYLSEKVGGRDFMTAKELEKYVLPIPPTKQTKMRYARTFPIPHHKVGKTVLYHIDEIAKYVVEGKQETTTKITSADLNTSGKQKLVKLKQKGNFSDDDFDLSHAFALRIMFDDLEEELERKNQLKNMLEKVIDRKGLHDKLQNNLSSNNSDKPRVKKA